MYDDDTYPYSVFPPPEDLTSDRVPDNLRELQVVKLKLSEVPHIEYIVDACDRGNKHTLVVRPVYSTTTLRIRIFNDGHIECSIRGVPVSIESAVINYINEYAVKKKLPLRIVEAEMRGQLLPI